jgi:hypothetical protein
MKSMFTKEQTEGKRDERDRERGRGTGTGRKRERERIKELYH